MPPKITAKSSKDHVPNQMVISMVAAVTIAHLLNDLIQAVLPAIYPMLKIEFNLSFSQSA